MRPRSVILGMGSAVPGGVLEQGAACSAAQAVIPTTGARRDRFQRIYAKSGVTTRRSVLLDPVDPTKQAVTDTVLDQAGGVLGHAYPPGKPPTTAQRMQSYAKAAAPLAERAARKALAAAKSQPAHITQLVTASCTGAGSPGVDIALMERLGLPSGTQRTHIGFMGCHAAINTLRVADAFAQSAPGGVVLGVCVELCTLHFQYDERPDQLVANALFGDAAGAFVMADGDLDKAGGLPINEARLRPRLVGTASWVLPETADWMTWTLGDRGFIMTLDRRVPDAVCQHVRTFVEPFLGGLGYTLADMFQVLTHPGGPRVLDAVSEGLKLPGDAHKISRHLLETYGNVSSATLLMTMEQSDIVGPTLLLAFGPGLTFEAALFDVDQPRAV